MKYQWLLLTLLGLSSVCFAEENIFYALRYQTPDRISSDAHTRSSLNQHFKKIDILIPQAYAIHADGEVKKGVEPEILAFAKAHAMKIMPLVVNTQFNTDIAHQFLSNPSAQAKAIRRLLILCRENHFYGLQLDFEMIRLNDRDALTHFYQSAANALHKEKYLVSFAVAPIVTDTPTTLFSKKIYENWEGAYDIKALGKIADFLTIMAYNQHGVGTTPGAAANLPWTESAVKYALQYVPANKISLGLPVYSMYWFTGKKQVNGEEKIAVRAKDVDYGTAVQLIKNHQAAVMWNQTLAVHYGIFEKNWLNQYVFLEDGKSFKNKQQLVKKYHLRGVSVFDLGTEDAAIWTYIR